MCVCVLFCFECTVVTRAAQADMPGKLPKLVGIKDDQSHVEVPKASNNLLLSVAVLCEVGEKNTPLLCAETRRNTDVFMNRTRSKRCRKPDQKPHQNQKRGWDH